MSYEEEFSERVCLLAEYILPRWSKDFSFKVGVFHGQPMIIEQTKAVTDLKHYLAVKCEKEFSDEEFMGYFSAFCQAIYDRQDEYKRNVFLLADGTMRITSYNQYVPVQNFPECPKAMAP